MFENRKIKARGKRIAAAIRDEKRGYSINGKIFFTAYLIEVGIIGAAAYAGWQFANHYAVGDTWTMAIIATVAIGFAEMGRLMMVHGFRTQRSYWMKGAMLLGVGMMCIVTTKSMSQVMEQMFHPRLRFVQEASLVLTEAEMARTSLDADRKAAADKLGTLNADVQRLDDHLKEQAVNIGKQGQAPAQRAEKYTVRGTCVGKSGKRYGCNKSATRYVDVAWAGAPLVKQLDDMRQQRTDAATTRDKAIDDLRAIEKRVIDADTVVTEKTGIKQKAVSESQLHSFTAMVFGKDPVQVTDGEVHWFLRFFVLIPAMMIALASSLLMMAAYTAIPAKKTESEEDRTRNVTLDIINDGTLAAHINSNVVHQLKRAN